MRPQPPAPLPARRAYRPEGRAYASESEIGYTPMEYHAFHPGTIILIYGATRANGVNIVQRVKRKAVVSK